MPDEVSRDFSAVAAAPGCTTGVVEDRTGRAAGSGLFGSKGLGAPAGTTRGFGVAEFREIGQMIVEVLDGLARNGEGGNAGTEAAVKARAIQLCKRFPIYAG